MISVTTYYVHMYWWIVAMVVYQLDIPNYCLSLTKRYN